MANGTCYGCSNRHPGCHSDCELYIKYKSELEEKRILIQKAKEKSGIYWGYKRKVIDKARKSQ